MLFRRKHRLAPPPVRVSNPVVDAQIHWLANRGLVLRDGVTTEQWLDSAEDPTDPISLAQARVDRMLCVEPNPMVTLEVDDLVTLVHSMADGLELPIDEAEIDSGTLRVRAANTHLSVDTVNRDPVGVLKEVAEEFVDSAHLLLTEGRSLAIVHRDVAGQAEVALRESVLRAE